MITVPYVDLAKQNSKYKKELINSFNEMLKSGDFILGKKVKEFESKFSKYIGCNYSVGVGNGTDALFLSLKYHGIKNGDEVITTPNSYLASTSSIILSGAKPVFVDIGNDLNIDTSKIEKKINKKTKAILPVHLTGSPSNIETISYICKKYNLKLIEDCAQSVGAEFKNKKVGSFGSSGCFSLHPLKNLNALGDAGIITTNSKRMYNWLLQARNHGHLGRDECSFWSHNMRLDTIQASFLLLKLKDLNNIIKKRRKIANIYINELKNIIETPTENINSKSVYHTFICKTEYRDELMKFLLKKNIETKIHYPTPIHLLKSFNKKFKKNSFPISEKLAKKIISLPIGEYLSDSQINYTINNIKKFFK